MVYNPDLNYSSEYKLDLQRAKARQQAEKWDADHASIIIDAEFVDVTEQVALPETEPQP